MKKKMKFLILFVILIIFLINIKETSALENIDYTNYYENSELLYEMRNGSTNIELFSKNGKTYTIDDYKEYLYTSGMTKIQYEGQNSTNCNSAVFVEEDPIVNIIPKEFFLTEGTKFVSGDAYGYYIETQKPQQEGYNTNNAYYCSSVFVFKLYSNIKNGNNISNNIENDIIYLDLKPLFQYSYITASNSNNLPTYWQSKININLSGSYKVIPNFVYNQESDTITYYPHVK